MSITMVIGGGGATEDLLDFADLKPSVEAKADSASNDFASFIDTTGGREQGSAPASIPQMVSAGGGGGGAAAISSQVPSQGNPFDSYAAGGTFETCL